MRDCEQNTCEPKAWPSGGINAYFLRKEFAKDGRAEPSSRAKPLTLPRMHSGARRYFAPVLSIVLAATCSACTTVGVSPSAALLKRPICSHSNDGDGDVAGYLHQIPSQSFPPGALRHVKYGNIPQVSHTYAYKTEGYAVVNEHKVGLVCRVCRQDMFLQEV